MAPLQFRAWHKTEKVLGHVVGFHFCESDAAVSSVTVDLYPELPTWNFEDCVIQQSTGFTDKNGKEIFEGDIVKEWNQDYRGKDFVLKDTESENFLLQVKWLDGGFSADGPMKGGRSIVYPRAFRELEVVGNIYENPDLLPPL